MFNKSRNPETGKFDASAFAMRNGANGMSLTRLVVGLGITEYILDNPDYRSFPLAAAAGVTAIVTDSFDGKLARKAARRLKTATTKFGQWLDQVSDKIVSNSIVGAMIAQEMATGNRTYGTALLITEIPILSRDIYTTVVRARASKETDVKARESGKVKALIGAAAVTAALSPLADSPLGEAGVIAGMSVYAYTSITSGIELVRGIREQQRLEVGSSGQQSPIDAV